MFNIEGNSGCEISIFNKSHHAFVRKKSAGPEYNKRLIAQAEKQNRLKVEFSSLSKIFVPEVVEVSDDNFVMKFFHGDDAVTFFDNCSIQQLSSLVDTITCLLKYEIEHSSASSFDKDVFLDKFLAVEKKIDRSELDFDKIRIYFESLPVEDIPTGMCHGDLTFSNILFDKKENVCLIDFLDTFYETPLQDMVKIRQDTVYNWSKLMCKKICDPTRYDMVMKYLDSKLHSCFSEYDFYNSYYSAFQIMNHLRILPYAKNDLVKRHVTSKLKEMIDLWT
tara:strand:+ start:760 stop:1593 length:834 start_codon:yes stop_codon:yes gene_type:complete